MKKFWNKETCYNEAKKYKTKVEFRENSHSAYVISTKNNWYKEYDWLIGVKRNYWNKETCYNEAKKYKTKVEFKNACVGAYDVSCRNKWINEWFTDINKKWTYEVCKEEALKYTSLKDFRKNLHNCYLVCIKNKWLNDFTWLKRIGKPRGYWTLEQCKKAALSCFSKSDFNRKFSGAYDACKRNNWVNQLIFKLV